MLTRRSSLALAFGGLVFAIMSGFTIYAEFSPLVKLGVTIPEKVASLVGEAIRPGPSYPSKFQVLNACNQGLNSLDAAVLPPEQMQRFYQHCAEIAQSIAAETPSFSLAYYVQALIAEGRGDLPELHENLIQAQRTAPGQGWLALSRAIVAVRHFDTLEEDGLRALDRDMATLLRSGQGAEWLAKTYAGGGILAERIITVVEQLPGDQQRHFLWLVRRLNSL